MAGGEISGYLTRSSGVVDARVVTVSDCTGNKVGMDVSVCGGSVGSVPSGLKTAGLITVVTLSAVGWTLLPATALINRNAIGVQNESGIEIKLNFSTPGGYVGWTVRDGGEFYTDITDSVVIYGRAASGTPTVNVMEIS